MLCEAGLSPVANAASTGSTFPNQKLASPVSNSIKPEGAIGYSGVADGSQGFPTLRPGSAVLKGSSAGPILETAQVREVNLAGDNSGGSPDSNDSSSGNGAGDLRLSGALDRKEVTLAAPANWVLTAGSYLTVQLSHSALLLPEYSSLTLIVNDQPVSSLRLDSTNQRDYRWQVALPEGTRPEGGRLRLAFAAGLRSSPSTCAAPDDPANWVTISGQLSRAHLEYTVQAAPVTLADLPQRLFPSSSLADRNIKVVVPPNPSQRDLARAALVLARLGSLAGYDSLNVSLVYGAPTPAPDSTTPPSPVITVSAAQEVQAASGSQIWVGGPALFPMLGGLDLPAPVSQAGQAYTVDGQAVPPESGMLQAKEMGGGSLLVVAGGGSEEGADRAVQALLDDRSLGLLRGPYAVIAPGSEYTAPPQPDNHGNNPILKNGLNNFASLGFDNQTVSGLGSRDARFNFFIPASSIASADARLSLNFSFSGLVDSRRSSLTVLFNDISLQTVPLSAAQALDTTPVAGATPLPGDGAGSASNPALKTSRLNLDIPRDLLRSGDNSLVVRFGLVNTQGSETCPVAPDPANFWGTVYRTSEINFPGSPQAAQSNDLSLFPYPYAGGAIASLIILPDAPGPAELRMAAQLAAEFGRAQPDGQLNRISLVAASQVTPEQLAKTNLVLVGTPANNRLLKEINGKLPVSWENATARTLTTRWGLRLTATAAGGLAGLAEMLPSPWNEQLSLLAVLPGSNPDTGSGQASGQGQSTTTGPAPATAQATSPLQMQPLAISPDQANLEAFVNAFSRHFYIGKFSGNVLAVDTKGKSYAFSTIERPVALEPDLIPTTGPADNRPAGAASLPPTAQAGNGPDNQTQSQTKSGISRDHSALLLGAAAIISLLVLAFIFLVRRSRQIAIKRGKGGLQ
jgi:hypothetical protein